MIVTDQELRSKLSEAASARILGMNSFVSQAPVQVIVVRENANMSARIGATVKNKDYSLIDIGIASENICLQARAEGIGSCMIGWFDEKQVKKILGIPSSRRVELIITLGYPEKKLREKRRKPVSETVSYNKY
ncbi:MAG: nitroreductase [Odoribacter sp.]|nr:nitroreductase [Odoribacter sp.]